VLGPQISNIQSNVRIQTSKVVYCNRYVYVYVVSDKMIDS